MYNYSFFQWVAFFCIYCFIGWLFESIYVSIEYRKWVNRGFLNGPFLPIYGFGAIIMLFCSLPVRKSTILVFFFGMAGATALEYFTGYVMEKIFHVKYWDYSYEPFNVNGYICLGCSIMWGFLSVVLVKIIHTPVENLILGINSKVLIILDILFAAGFVSDLIMSAREAFDLRRIIDEKILQNEKVLRLQKRVDVLMAFINDDKEKLQEKLESSKAELERIKLELTGAREKYIDRIEKYKKNANRVIKRNPGSTSGKHRVEFNEIREWLSKKQ